MLLGTLDATPKFPNIPVSPKVLALKVGLKLNIQKNEDHGTHSHYFLANKRGNNGNSTLQYYWASQGQPKGTALGALFA